MARFFCIASALMLVASLSLAQDKPKAEKPAAPPVVGVDKPADKPATPASDKPAPPTPGTVPEKEPAPAPNSVEVTFADGSVVKLSLLESKLDVSTRFGKLSVPIGEIRKIEMGIRYPDGALQKIQTAIVQLGDPDFKKREAASNDLIAYRELAYPLVRRAVSEGNAEAQKRAKAVLEDLRKRIPEDRLAMKELDTVTTADFPIAGHIEASAFKASSPLLGAVDVKLFQVRGIRWLGHSNEVTLTVDASKHGGPGENWFDTGLDMNGDRITVVATGTVDVMPNNPGQYMAGPDGLRQELGFGRGNGALVGQPGALIAKIGQSGQPFLIGSKHDSTPRSDGRLYLRLEPSPWRVAQTGNFSVKIVTGK